MAFARVRSPPAESPTGAMALATGAAVVCGDPEPPLPMTSQATTPAARASATIAPSRTRGRCSSPRPAYAPSRSGFSVVASSMGSADCADPAGGRNVPSLPRIRSEDLDLIIRPGVSDMNAPRVRPVDDGEPAAGELGRASLVPLDRLPERAQGVRERVGDDCQVRLRCTDRHAGREIADVDVPVRRLRELVGVPRLRPGPLDRVTDRLGDRLEIRQGGRRGHPGW